MEEKTVALISNEALDGLFYLVATEDPKKQAETLTPFHGQGMSLEVVEEWQIPDANATVNYLLDSFNYGRPWKVGNPSHWLDLRPYELAELKAKLDYFSTR